MSAVPKDPDLNLLKEQILFAVEASAHWRRQKAVEYPHDTRNEQSAAALHQLARHLSLLPVTHREFELLADVWFGPAEGIEEAQSRVINRYGFDRHEIGDPEQFLRALRKEIETEIGWQPDVPVSAQDIDGLGPAVSPVTIMPTVYAWGPEAQIVAAQNATVSAAPSAHVRKLQESIDKVLARLDERNDVSPEAKAQLRHEIRAGEELLMAPRADRKLIDLLLTRPLKFIADKAAGGVIGAAAVSALFLLHKYLGGF